MGVTGGLRSLERIEIVTVGIKLSLICALLLALAAITDIRAGGLTAWEERDQA